MAYETGAAADRHDLLAKLKTFLQTAGWSVNLHAADGASGWRLHVAKDGVFANLRSTSGSGEALSSGWSSSLQGLGSYGSTGFDAGLAWDNQPGAPRTSSNAMRGVTLSEATGALPAYWFFAHETSVDVFVEVAVGQIRSLHWGNLVKFGDYAGGMYFGGSGRYNHATTFSLPFVTTTAFAYLEDTDHANGWYNFNTARAIMPPLPSGTTSTDGFLSTILQSAISLGGVTPLLPLYFATGSPNFWPLGYAPHLRVVRRDYLTVGAEIDLGDETWMVFPIADLGSLPLGLAVRKVL